MVVWSQYLQNVADFLNTSTSEAGTIMSLMITISVVLIILISTKGKGAEIVVPVMLFFSIVFFTFIGWFPTWTGSVIAIVLAILIGYLFNRMYGVT